MAHSEGGEIQLGEPTDSIFVRNCRTFQARPTWGQQFMWEVCDRIGGGGAPLAIAVHAPIPPRTSYEQVCIAVQTLFERHDALRTRFLGDSLWSLRQEILSSLDVPVYLLPANSAPGTGDAHVESLRAPGFVTNDHPLVRVGIFGTKQRPKSIALVISHMVIDGWSSRQIREELMAILTGRNSDMAAVQQPVDQALFEASANGRTVSTSALHHQRSVFERLPPTTPRGNHFRPEYPRYRQGTYYSPGMYPAAQQAARIAGVSVSSLLLWVSVQLISEHSGTNEVPLLMWTHNRFRPESREIVSQFTQVVPMIFDTKAGDSGSIRATQRKMMSGLRHGLYPPIEAAQLRAEFEQQTLNQLPLGFRFNYIPSPSTSTDRMAFEGASSPPAFSWSHSADVEDIVASFDALEFSHSIRLYADTRFIPSSDVEEMLREFDRRVRHLAR